jgi:probable HAF family extracellular repeat protein
VDGAVQRPTIYRAGCSRCASVHLGNNGPKLPAIVEFTKATWYLPFVDERNTPVIPCGEPTCWMSTLFEEVSDGGIMRNLTKLTLGIGFTFLVVATAQAQLYRITDLGTLPGGMTSEAAAINDHGQVVGAASVPQGTHAFLWTHSRGMQDLGSLPGGGSYSYAVGINHGGTIAGSSDFTQPYTGNTHAFLWTRSSGMRDLGTLGCPDITGATGINFFSEVVGISTIAPCPGGGQYRAFIAYFATSNGIMHSLGTLQGGDFSVAEAINFFGDVAGYSGCSPCSYGSYHAFLWTKADGMQDLGTLPGGTTSSASGINSFGSIIGGSDFQRSPGQLPHAFLWNKDAGMTDLGALPGGSYSYAIGINDRNEVVGDSQYANSYGSGAHAFLWSKEKGMQDLNDLVRSDSKWVLRTARAINERGQIVGSGTINRQTHAFLLTPRRDSDGSGGDDEEERKDR